MLVGPLLSAQRIIDCLNINYAIKVIKLTILPLEADLNACVYKAEAQDQSSYFVKLKRGHHDDISIAIMELLRNAGIKQIIPSIKTTNNLPMARIDDFTCIVYPFIEGEDGFSRALVADQWITLGKTLRLAKWRGRYSSENAPAGLVA